MKKREMVSCTIEYSYNQGSSKGRFGAIVAPRGFSVNYSVPREGATPPPPQDALIDAFKNELYEDEQDISLAVSYTDEPLFVRFHLDDQWVEYYPVSMNGRDL